MECLLATLIIIFPRRYPAKRSSRIRAWFNQRRLNRLPVVCLPLKLKRFQLNLSDTDISPAFTRDFRIFVFAILPTLSLSPSLSFGFFTVPKRNRERMQEEERAHCTQSDDAAAAAAKRKATKRSISPTVIVQRMRRREGEKSRNYSPAATSQGSSTGNDS